MIDLHCRRMALGLTAYLPRSKVVRSKRKPAYTRDAPVSGAFIGNCNQITPAEGKRFPFIRQEARNVFRFCIKIAHQAQSETNSLQPGIKPALDFARLQGTPDLWPLIPAYK